MDDTPDGGDLTPPGPPPSATPEPERPTGGLSMDDWIAAQRSRPAEPRGFPQADLPHASPYAPMPPLGSPPPVREFDRASLVGFALSLTGIASIVGVVLGVLGLRRTADGTKDGRWAAILAVVIGLVATLGIVVAVAGMVWFRDNVRTTARVEAGTCVDVDDSDGVLFFPRSCTSPHHGEVVATGKFRGRAAIAIINAPAAQFCFAMADEGYRRAARTGDYSVSLVFSAEERGHPGPDDSFACYYSRRDGLSLDEPIPTGAGS
ncbi:hypothetical protein F0U44_09300 [Nocardioides humilatus]|uniref:DUF4190 domain-containing protein n=1 Tax=Nocardioides humilatus TaxID=2607660 RepID=A0A5B1LDG5_9ACTN|nr:hypothetical protein [Nocardioides humilatus]KAA1418682.1 hypothetical protein F0U44_09300 [Nocardioides humilatus]